MKDILYNIQFGTYQSECHKNENFAKQKCEWHKIEFYAII